MTKILITGGTGLIGNLISKQLLAAGREPVFLSRRAGEENGIKKFKWDIEKGLVDPAAFEGVEHVIHLAGAGIADKRWTKKYRREILDSRVKSSAVLFEQLSKHKITLKSFTGASAIGYYGARQSQRVMTEEEPFYPDFLGHTCLRWEQSYASFIEAGIRTSIIRAGVVLSRDGGAWQKMAVPFRLGLGAVIGSGRQYLSWIHVHDIARVYLHALLNENISGTFNAVAPQPVTNSEFSKLLSRSLHRPLILPPVPSFALKAVMGESAKLSTEGVNVSCRKLVDTGFRFEFGGLEKALEDLAMNR